MDRAGRIVVGKGRGRKGNCCEQHCRQYRSFHRLPRSFFVSNADFSTVMAGLVPAITSYFAAEDVDARHKAGHDVWSTHYVSFAFTIPLALAISICPAYLPRRTPMTLPISFMPAAAVSLIAASMTALISASDICFGR